MPLIDISIAEGRSAEQLRELIDAVHLAVLDTIDAAPENVTVIVRQVEAELWARGNLTIAERRPAATPQT